MITASNSFGGVGSFTILSIAAHSMTRISILMPIFFNCCWIMTAAFSRSLLPWFTRQTNSNFLPFLYLTESFPIFQPNLSNNFLAFSGSNKYFTALSECAHDTGDDGAYASVPSFFNTREINCFLFIPYASASLARLSENNGLSLFNPRYV